MHKQPTDAAWLSKHLGLPGCLAGQLHGLAQLHQHPLHVVPRHADGHAGQQADEEGALEGGGQGTVVACTIRLGVGVQQRTFSAALVAQAFACSSLVGGMPFGVSDLLLFSITRGMSKCRVVKKNPHYQGCL